VELSASIMHATPVFDKATIDKWTSGKEQSA
jgi:hypothetical protein